MGKASKYQLAGVNNQAAEPPDENYLFGFSISPSSSRISSGWSAAAGLLPPTRQTDARKRLTERTNKQTDHPESNQTTNNTREIRISGKSAPMRINIGRMTLSACQPHRSTLTIPFPRWYRRPVEPDNRRNQYRQRAKLDKAERIINTVSNVA